MKNNPNEKAKHENSQFKILGTIRYSDMEKNNSINNYRTILLKSYNVCLRKVESSIYFIS